MNFASFSRASFGKANMVRRSAGIIVSSTLKTGAFFAWKPLSSTVSLSRRVPGGIVLSPITSLRGAITTTRPEPLFRILFTSLATVGSSFARAASVTIRTCVRSSLCFAALMRRHLASRRRLNNDVTCQSCNLTDGSISPVANLVENARVIFRRGRVQELLHRRGIFALRMVAEQRNDRVRVFVDVACTVRWVTSVQLPPSSPCERLAWPSLCVPPVNRFSVLTRVHRPRERSHDLLRLATK
ncbi:hypothetical protein KC356_g136 [Hortaea werneckii]|nr:hypothetical protein KC356_g136 [Hortaea werneckii]